MNTDGFEAEVLTIELEVAHLFAGTGAKLVADESGYAGYRLETAGAVGFAVNVDPTAPGDPSHLSLAIVKDTDPATASEATYVGLDFELIDAHLQGISGLVFEASGTVLVNWASEGAQRLNWYQAWANEQRPEDEKRLPKFSEELSPDVAMWISGDLALDVFGFVVAVGGDRPAARSPGRGGRHRAGSGAAAAADHLSLAGRAARRRLLDPSPRRAAR